MDYKDFQYLETNKWYVYTQADLKKYFRYYNKAKVIETGLNKKVNYLSKLHYENSLNGVVEDEIEDNLFIEVMWDFGKVLYDEALRVNNAYYARVTRLKERIEKYLQMGNCIFCTFTFTDEVLEKTNIKTRRKYITRFLRSISSHYVANIDYGADDNYTHREHYHALVVTDFVGEKWDYGFTWYERTYARDIDTNNKLISKYISKLTNHAIKVTTKRNYLIYSKET